MGAKTIKALVAVLLLVGLVQAQFNHPELEWQTIESEYAIVHFHQGTERTAREVAGIADLIYKPITTLYGYEPDAKVQWVIKDTDDYANGGAYYYDQKIEIWATPLDFELRGTHHWLYNVVTHEFTHIIQLGSARKYPRWMPGIYFQWIGYEEEKRPDVLYGYPNQIMSYPVAGTVVPMWFAEGTAQFQALGLGHDYWDSHRDMLLRTRSLDGKMLTWNQMGVFGKNTLGSESVYNSGYGLTRYIAKRWGQEAIADLTRALSKPHAMTFDQICKDIIGLTGEQLYQQWVKDIGAEYSSRTAMIRDNPLSGKQIDEGGFANLYPVFSPDGKRIAFMSNEGRDYMSLSSLWIFNVDSGKAEKSEIPAKGRVSWSPDSKHLLYARQRGPNSNGSSFDDLYLWDFKREKEIRLTVDARLSQPQFSPDGKQIVAVHNSGGTHNLALLDVPDDLEHFEGVIFDIFHLGKDAGTYFAPTAGNGTGDAHSGTGTPKKSAQLRKKLEHRLLTNFDNGEQVFLPVWSLDGSAIYCSASNLAARDIYRYTVADSSWSPFIATPFDERDLVFAPDGSSIYYADDRTGIFNIYRKSLGSDTDSPLTNVVGGAFLPSVTADGKVAYAEYTADGYQVRLLDSMQTVLPENMLYLAPSERETANRPPPPSSKAIALQYNSPFGSLFVLPRITWDYNKFKPGFYAYTNDFLEKISLFGAAAMNMDGERDLYASIEYRVLKPTLFLEGFNITRQRQEHFEDNFVITGKRYERQPNGDSLAIPIFDQYAVDYSFTLNEVDAGARHYFNEKMFASATFRWGAYKSALRFSDGGSFDYTYYTGRQYIARLESDARIPSVGMDIHPKGGWKGWVEYAYEDNQFIEGFEILAGKGTISEVYKPYRYHRVEADLQHFYPMFKGNLVLNSQLIGGIVSDDNVDSFFHLYAGGLIGLRGYSFYSMGGTRKAVGRLTARFPLLTGIDSRFGPFYLDRVHAGLFAEAGDAWTGDPDFSKLKRDVGIDLRVKLYSWYGYPTDIQFTTAYGLDQFNVTDDRKGIHTYGKDWRWYITVLFDFL